MSYCFREKTHLFTERCAKAFTPERFWPLEAEVSHHWFTAGSDLLAQRFAGRLRLS